MSSDENFLTFLARERREATSQLERLKRKLAGIDAAEELYRKSKAASTNEGAGSDKSPNSQGVFAPLRPRPVGTLKQRIIDVLERHPSGLPSGELLIQLRAMNEPDLQRTTMSPQLTRLKEEKTLVSVDGVWRLATHHKALVPDWNEGQSNSGV